MGGAEVEYRRSELVESMLRLARGAPGGHGLFLFEKIAKVLDLEDKQRDPQLSMLLIVIL
jgi:hypothetical protein